MSCKYKDECPSYTGWCECEKQKYEECPQFLITAYENEKKRANKLQEQFDTIVHDILGSDFVMAGYKDDEHRNDVLTGAVLLELNKTKFKRKEKLISRPKRKCRLMNSDTVAKFIDWEHYSMPLEASPLVGGAPAGVFSRIYAVVELEDGQVVRTDADNIIFI